MKEEMMIIDDNYALDSDGTEIQLKKRYINKKTGEEYYTVIGHYNDIRMALKGYYRQSQKDIFTGDIKALMDKLDEIGESINELKVKFNA